MHATRGVHNSAVPTNPSLALFAILRFLAVLVGLAGTGLAYAQLPKRDLHVELRQVEEGREAAQGYRASTGPATVWTAQSLSVRNSEKGVLRAQQSVPMQWLQSAQSQSTSLTVPNAASSSSGGGVTQGPYWFDVGQSMTVRPKWPGGKKDVVLEIKVLQEDISTLHNADLPQQARIQLSTTVTVPLNQWVTIAASGKGAPAAGNYSSESATEARRLLQVRVSVP